MKFLHWVTLAAACLINAGCATYEEASKETVAEVNAPNAVFNGTQALPNLMKDSLDTGEEVHKHQRIPNTERMSQSVASMGNEIVPSNINLESKKVELICKMDKYGEPGMPIVRDRYSPDKDYITYFQNGTFSQFIKDDWRGASKCIQGMKRLIDDEIDMGYHTTFSPHFKIGKSFEGTYDYVVEDINVEVKKEAAEQAKRDAAAEVVLAEAKKAELKATTEVAAAEEVSAVAEPTTAQVQSTQTTPPAEATAPTQPDLGGEEDEFEL